MRSMEMSAKTVEAAVQAACEALGVDRDDINVSYEVLEFPTRKLFKTIPAKVLVKVEEPEAEKPAEVSTKPAEVVEISDETPVRKSRFPLTSTPTRACRPPLTT